MRTRVKICGITNTEDALVAVAHGADAIGLVFYGPSPRCISIQQALKICQAIPPFVSIVALFVNPTANEVNEVLASLPIDVLQFHGDEDEANCLQYQLPYLKAIRVKQDTNLIQYAQIYSSAQGLLLDTYSDSAYGGTGETFDWRMIPKDIPKPIILAGGLNADNVAKAIAQTKPYAVDVSGGVEVTKGIKDASKIAQFMTAVNAAHDSNKV